MAQNKLTSSKSFEETRMLPCLALALHVTQASMGASLWIRAVFRKMKPLRAGSENLGCYG